jgi:hypothetical protein
MQAACKVTGVKHVPSTLYHPRTDGQSERTNQWLEMAIRFITDQKQKNWAPYLPIAQFAHNNWPSDTTRKSPFFLLMGCNPRADWVHATSPIPRVTLRLEQMKEARVQAREAMIKAQQSWIKHRDTPKYKEGDLVWLEFPLWHCNKQPDNCGRPRAHSSHTRYTGYLNKMYQKTTPRQRFGKPTLYPIDITHSQVHQKNQEFQRGTQLSSIQNKFVG